MKAIRIIAIIAFIGGIISWMGFKLYTNKQELEEEAQIQAVEDLITVRPVNAASVTRQQISDTLALQGNFEARKELQIIAEAQGRITALYIEEGQRINKGQRVAKIDATSLQSQLSTSKAVLAKAEKDVERFERLYKAGAVSLQQLEDVRLNAQNAASNLTGLEQQLDYTYVKSPMSGTVSVVDVEEGSFAAPGSPLASVVDISRLKMVVRVPEEEVVQLKEGQRVRVRADVYPDKEITGKISLISVQADVARKYKVEIDVPNTGESRLRAGMYGTAIFDLNDTDEPVYRLLIPRKSIVTSVKSPEVYVIQPDSTVTRRSIKIGERLQDMIVVTEGLQEGTPVVTSGHIGLEEGMKVKLVGE